tara:strand:+ start:298 stop:510 length:213 start_codon:yes stop_codon:yes gene_type:complete
MLLLALARLVVAQLNPNNREDDAPVHRLMIYLVRMKNLITMLPLLLQRSVSSWGIQNRVFSHVCNPKVGM